MRLFLLFQILLVALPFIVYRFYVGFVMRRKVQTEGKYNEVPLTLLLIAGLVLAGLAQVTMGLMQERDTAIYEKARMDEDGTIIPPKKK